MIKDLKISLSITYFLLYGGIIGMLFMEAYRPYYIALTIAGLLLMVLKNLNNKTLSIIALDSCIGFVAVLMGFIIPDMIGFFKQLLIASLLAIYTTWIINYQKQKSK